MTARENGHQNNLSRCGRMWMMCSKQLRNAMSTVKMRMHGALRWFRWYWKGAQSCAQVCRSKTRESCSLVFGIDTGHTDRKYRQGQEVSPSLLPHIPGQTKIGRAVDYTFTFPIRKQRVKKTYNQIAFLQPNQTISHTTDPFTKRIALFSGIKVKESNGDNKEALLQLTIWLSAGLEKLQRLGNSRNKELDGSQLLPTIGWTVIGHDWHLYIGFRGTFERQDKIVSKPTLYTLLWFQANFLVHRGSYWWRGR